MKLIILDRDGVINEDSDAYIKSVDEWIPIAGSTEAMAQLTHAGYSVTIATNQSGIGRGYYDVATLDAMHAKLRDLLAPLGGKVDYIAYCPHVSEDQCACRKPKAGLLQAIGAHFAADLTQAIVVGDSLRDWQAAAAVGANYAQVRTGKGLKTLADPRLPRDIPVFDNLAQFVATLLAND